MLHALTQRFSAEFAVPPTWNSSPTWPGARCIRGRPVPVCMFDDVPAKALARACVGAVDSGSPLSTHKEAQPAPSQGVQVDHANP